MALILWVLLSLAALALCHGTMPLQIGPDPQKPLALVIFSSIALLFLLLEVGLIARITRNRPMPNLAERSPEQRVALRETTALWVYGAGVLLAGRFAGLHFFGEGIALHLNGSLVGATRLQSPHEVYTWAAYNGILLALVPHAYATCMVACKPRSWIYEPKIAYQFLVFDQKLCKSTARSRHK